MLNIGIDGHCGQLLWCTSMCVDDLVSIAKNQLFTIYLMRSIAISCVYFVYVNVSTWRTHSGSGYTCWCYLCEKWHALLFSYVYKHALLLVWQTIPSLFKYIFSKKIQTGALFFYQSV